MYDSDACFYPTDDDPLYYDWTIRPGDIVHVRLDHVTIDTWPTWEAAAFGRGPINYEAPSRSKIFFVVAQRNHLTDQFLLLIDPSGHTVWTYVDEFVRLFGCDY